MPVSITQCAGAGGRQIRHHAHGDTAVFGEFERVANEIDDLFELVRIGLDQIRGRADQRAGLTGRSRTSPPAGWFRDEDVEGHGASCSSTCAPRFWRGQLADESEQVFAVGPMRSRKFKSAGTRLPALFLSDVGETDETELSGCAVRGSCSRELAGSGSPRFGPASFPRHASVGDVPRNAERADNPPVLAQRHLGARPAHTAVRPGFASPRMGMYPRINSRSSS